MGNKIGRVKHFPALSLSGRHTSCWTAKCFHSETEFVKDKKDNSDSGGMQRVVFLQSSIFTRHVRS